LKIATTGSAMPQPGRRTATAIADPMLPLGPVNVILKNLIWKD